MGDRRIRPNTLATLEYWNLAKLRKIGPRELVSAKRANKELMECLTTLTYLAAELHLRIAPLPSILEKPPFMDFPQLTSLRVENFLE